jgi:glucosylglycerate synthase
VAPSYQRHPFEGALVRSIVAPVFRACFGLRLAQPTARDFACSRRFVEHTLAPGAWTADAGDAGIDLWLAATAASNEFHVCEAPLGARMRATRDDAPDLSTTLGQVVGSLFGEVERRAPTWHRTRGSRRPANCGAAAGPISNPPPVDPSRMMESFRLGYRELAAVWSDILPPAAILELRRLAAATDATFHLDDRVWARIVYDFAVGYRLRVIAREHLLGALTPIYLGWLASFVLAVRRASSSADEIDARAETLCEVFEAEKPYLISRWRWPERIQPSRF